MMETLNFINNIFKYSFINIMSFYIFIKSTNSCKNIKKTILFMLIPSILIGIIHALLINILPQLLLAILSIIIIGVIMKLHNNIKIEYSIIISCISMGISISCYLLSLLVISIILTSPIIKLEKENPISFVICAILNILLVNRFFNIPRFRNGLSFLKNTEKLNTISILGFVFSGALVTFFSTSKNIASRSTRLVGITGILLIIIGTFIWIKRNITLDYQDRMKNRKIENLEKELADKEKINAELTEEIKSLTMINHQYNSRIKAAKQEIEKLAFAFKNGTNTEFSAELSEVTKLVNNLSSEYSNKVNSVLKYSKPLPKTNVKGVDSILEHMKLEATKKNIDFDLKVNCSVKHLIEKFISQSELETLISDHVKDAIIAVGYSESTPRSICVIFDIIDNCYRFSVYDSGIDFEIDTLVNLGLDAITTHKDDGGTGLGFLTTFGTLDKCKASLVIDEINFKNSNFSKSVNIIFDRKHEYIVRSSRTEEIKKSDENSRIILQNKD